MTETKVLPKLEVTRKATKNRTFIFFVRSQTKDGLGRKNKNLSSTRATKIKTKNDASKLFNFVAIGNFT
jgi:hypothetical protein